MQLSKRLHAVASLVTPGNRVADVGCDHAYTAIYLAEHKISPHIIAMDINQGPIDRAKENIIKYGYTDRIDVRKSNGLEKLKEGEVDTIVIAGMGGGLTIQILSERMEIIKLVKELVLQPQSEVHKVRQMLFENNFLITEENMMKEDGKYYVMMKAEPRGLIKEDQAFILTREEHYYYGRLLLEQNHPVLSALLLWELAQCQNIIRTLASEQTENSALRLMEIREKVEIINAGLGYYNLEKR